MLVFSKVVIYDLSPFSTDPFNYSLYSCSPVFINNFTMVLCCRVEYPQNSDPLYTEIPDAEADLAITTHQVNWFNNTIHVNHAT